MRKAATLRKDSHHSGIGGSILYWSLVKGDFPACLDDSEESLCSSDLAEGFDLIAVLNPPHRRTSGGQRLYRTDWIEYAEVFLKPGGAIAIYAEASISDELVYKLQASTLSVQRYSLHKDLILGVKAAVIPEFDFSSDKLIENLVEKLTRPGMLVLEPFATDERLLAYCQQAERYCLGIASRKSDFRQIESALRNSSHQGTQRKTTLKLLRSNLTSI